MTMDELDRPADEGGCTLELIWDEALNATARLREEPTANPN